MCIAPFAFSIDTDTIHSKYWLVVLPIKAALANVKPLTRGSLVQRRRLDTGQKNEYAYEYGNYSKQTLNDFEEERADIILQD